MTSPKQPSYPHRPILGLGTLSNTLQIPLSELIEVAAECDQLYRLAKPIRKPDGTFRQPFDALPRLKRIHKAMRDRILCRVIFPDYVTGSTRGKSARSNAAIHAGAKIMICEDIDSFFPSLGRRVIFDVWRNFFGFGEEVADLLTTLSLKDGAVPQGAIPSSYLANLAFWRHEPLLHAEFSAAGIAYSRYVDDVAVSSRVKLSRDEMADCIGKIYGMMYRHGCKPKRRKHEIFTSGQRMTATKLVTNKRPSLPEEYRSAVRSAVYQVERGALAGYSADLMAALDSASVRAGRVKSMHPTEGTELLRRLREVRKLIVTPQP